MTKAKPKPKRSASAVGKHSRNKGKGFERVVAAAFREVFGDQVKRGWQARQGSDAPDVEGVPGWWVEAKHHRKVSIRAAWQQVVTAQEDAKRKGDGRASDKPLVVCKDDGEEPLAVVRFSDFVALLELCVAAEKDHKDAVAILAGCPVPDFSAPEYAPRDEPNVAPAGAPNVLVLAQP